MSAQYNFKQRRITQQAILYTTIAYIGDDDTIKDLKSASSILMEAWGAYHNVIPKEELYTLNKIEALINQIVES